MRGRPAKKAEATSTENVNELQSKIEFLLQPYAEVLEQLIERIVALETKVFKPVVETKSIVKLEPGEQPIETRDESAIKMNDSDKIISMINACKILPPNMIVDGRHSKGNIEAICGFKVTDEMMEMCYENLVHDWS